jgi:sterol desaturase/sphingolipid hydroxylase (fatty acid hydroxylase superfamily)
MFGPLVHSFLRSAAGWFAFTFLSYSAVAGGAYLLFWVWGAKRWQHKQIEPEGRRAPQPWREFWLSVVLFAMFAMMLGAIRVLTELGWTRMYDDIATYGAGYFAASILIIAVVHDTYYYWAHRFMHSKLLFKRVHWVHHQFTNPTPFASYAFHPLEGVIELAIIGLLLLVMPIHPWALGAYFFGLTVLNVISHLGYELYPAWISRWFITSTHHNLHHARSHGHYMLYFNLWDRLMGTNHADYHAVCERLDAARPASSAKPI